MEQPTLPSGFVKCAAPSNVSNTEGPYDADAWGWEYAIYVSNVTGVTYYEYRYDDGDVQDSFWAKPQASTGTGGGSGTGSSVADVKKIQQALLAAGCNPGKIDGIWGPATCAAAYKFKREQMYDTAKELDSDFFAMLGFEGYGFESKYGNSCNKWWTGQGLSDDDKPTPPPAEDTEEVKAIKAIQTALKNAGFDPGIIDGAWGQNTCRAAYAFKLAKLNDTGSALDASFFAALNLGGKGYEARFAASCDPWYTAPTPPPTPGKKASKVPLIVGALGGLAIGAVAGPKVAKGSSPVVGALSGLVVGLGGGALTMLALSMKKDGTSLPNA